MPRKLLIIVVVFGVRSLTRQFGHIVQQQHVSLYLDTAGCVKYSFPGRIFTFGHSNLSASIVDWRRRAGRFRHQFAFIMIIIVVLYCVDRSMLSQYSAAPHMMSELAHIGELEN